jgi:hypothetical protein
VSRQHWVTCPWYGCHRRIVRLSGQSPFMHITPNSREMIPLPSLIAETAPGASVTFEEKETGMTCPRGHVTTYNRHL